MLYQSKNRHLKTSCHADLDRKYSKWCATAVSDESLGYVSRFCATPVHTLHTRYYYPVQAGLLAAYLSKTNAYLPHGTPPQTFLPNWERSLLSRHCPCAQRPPRCQHRTSAPQWSSHRCDGASTCQRCAGWSLPSSCRLARGRGPEERKKGVRNSIERVARLAFRDAGAKKKLEVGRWELTFVSGTRK